MIQLHKVRMMKEVISLLAFYGDRIADSGSWQIPKGLKSRKR